MMLHDILAVDLMEQFIHLNHILIINHQFCMKVEFYLQSISDLKLVKHNGET